MSVLGVLSMLLIVVMKQMMRVDGDYLPLRAHSVEFKPRSMRNSQTKVNHMRNIRTPVPCAIARCKKTIFFSDICHPPPKKSIHEN